MDFHLRKLKEVNELYTQHETTIEKLQAAVRREIPLLAQENQLDLTQIKALEAFVADKLTLFRFLRKNSFHLPTALSLLLDTMQWRLTNRVDELNLSQVQDLLVAPLCFFHNQDKCGRPILVIQLAYFPVNFRDNTDLVDRIMPLVIFILETARKLLVDWTAQRHGNLQKNPVLADVTILIDFKNANALPKDLSLLQTFMKLLKRYPGMAGMVCLLNFGWMYQGMWQMIKMILSQEAKNRVVFPKLKELRTFIDKSNLLSEFGGSDTFQWNIEQDTIFVCYQPGSMNHDVPDTNEKSISSSRRGLFYADPPAAPPPYQQQERTSINLDDDNSPSYSDYGTPMGSLTPPEPQQQTRYYHPGTLTSGMPKSPVRNDGISMPILSQRLSMLLQQQQQQQEGRKLSGIKSWISFFLNFVLYMENNLVVSITKYRFWLYCFAFLWMWRKGAHRLPLLRSFFIGNIYQPQRSNVSPLLS